MGENNKTKDAPRRYALLFPDELTEAIDKEIARRDLKITTWFEDVLLNGGLKYSRTQPSKSDRIAAASTD